MTLTSVVDRAGTRAATQADRDRPYAVASADVQALVKAALADRWTVGKIPDFNLLRDKARVNVLADIRRSRLRLGPEAMPTIEGATFTLLDLAAVRREAAATSESVYFLALDQVTMHDARGAIWLGVDFELPPGSTFIKMCCCEEEVVFERRNGSWVFAGMSGMFVCR